MTLLWLVQESSDISEARRCLIGLGVPFYLHELVKQALTLSIENPAAQPAMLSLIKQLSESGELTHTQINQGAS